MLPPEAIQEFREIYLKEEGITLTDSEAVAMANNLMGLFKTVVRTNSGQSLKDIVDLHNKK